MEKLSRRNAFRVVKIRSVDNPELGIMEFVYKGHKDDRGGYSHVMRNEQGEGIIPYVDMGRYEVVENKRTEITLDEFWDAAQMAFNWTSFDPERRGEDTIREQEEELNSDLKNIPDEEKERYISNYKKYFSVWLFAQSRCASSVITGGANFNTRRAEAANNRERSAMQQFIDWRERALKAIEKRKEEARPESEKRDEAWKRLKRDIL